MALANVACILAKNQEKLAKKSPAGSIGNILMIDWDLEAPSLHRYFRNYLQQHFSEADDLDSAFNSYPGTN